MTLWTLDDMVLEVVCSQNKLNVYVWNNEKSCRDSIFEQLRGPPFMRDRIDILIYLESVLKVTVVTTPPADGTTSIISSIE